MMIKHNSICEKPSMLTICFPILLPSSNTHSKFGVATFSTLHLVDLVKPSISQEKTFIMIFPCIILFPWRTLALDLLDLALSILITTKAFFKTFQTFHMVPKWYCVPSNSYWIIHTSLTTSTPRFHSKNEITFQPGFSSNNTTSMYYLIPTSNMG